MRAISSFAGDVEEWVKVRDFWDGRHFHRMVAIEGTTMFKLLRVIATDLCEFHQFCGVLGALEVGGFLADVSLFN